MALPGLPHDKHPTCEDGGFAHIYIDWSNISIQGRKVHYRETSITEEDDLTIRYDIGALKAIIIEGFGFSGEGSKIEKRFNFYGSNLDLSNEVFQNSGSSLARVVNCKRSSWTRREKQVDTSLVVDMAVEATHALHRETRIIFAMVSGDADLAPAVEKAAEYGYDVYVWSWKDALAQVYTDLKKNKEFGGRIKIRLLDEYVEKLTRLFPIDRTTILPHSAVVLTTSYTKHVLTHILESLPHNHWKAICTREDSGSSIEDYVFVPLTAPEETEDPQALLHFFKLHFGEQYVLSYEEYYRSEDEEVRQRRGLWNAFERSATSENSDYGSQDDQQDGFTVVGSSSKQASKRLNEDARKSAKRCQWRKYCSARTHCKYGHTADETKFFNTYGYKMAKKYRFCNRLNDCPHGAGCKYAHTKGQLFCPTCEATGDHEMQDCPENKRGM